MSCCFARIYFGLNRVSYGELAEEQKKQVKLIKDRRALAGCQINCFIKVLSIQKNRGWMCGPRGPLGSPVPAAITQTPHSVGERDRQRGTQRRKEKERERGRHGRTQRDVYRDKDGDEDPVDTDKPRATRTGGESSG